LDVDSKFPVWYADEGIILPDPVGPQKVLIDELLSVGREEAANKLTEWRTALRKQRGDGDWKFIGGSYSLHGCLGDGWNPTDPAFSDVGLQAWWSFAAPDGLSLPVRESTNRGHNQALTLDPGSCGGDSFSKNGPEEVEAANFVALVPLR
jgi:hypothetical protein